jgi:hypothetical protein
METDMAATLYMITERFKNGDAAPVYRRLLDKGRQAPAGLTYVSSWIDDSFQTCYQLMETDDPKLLHQWMEKWTDLVDFEVHRVMTSEEAADRIRASL